MNRYKKLLSDTAIYGIGTFASKLLVFFLTRLYTECLTEAQYGKADLISNMANLFIPLAAAGICDAIFRFALDREGNKKAVFSTGILILSASGSIFLLFSPLLLVSSYFRSYVWLIVLYVLMSNFHSACAQYIRALDKAKLFAVQGIINTVLTISLNVLFLVILPDSNFFSGEYGYVLSIVIADFLVGCFLLIYAKLWKDIKIKNARKDLAVSMLKYSLPLIPTTIFWWITNVSDRYMVTYFLGEGQNGLYTAAYKIPTLLTLVTGVFSEAWQFSAVKENDPEERAKFYSTVFSCFQAIIFVAGACVIAFSKVGAKILFAESYYSAWSFIPVLVMASVFSSFVNFLSSVYVVKKRSMKSFITAAIGAVVNIILNFLLIPSCINFGSFELKCVGLGVQGAAIATLASYIVVFIIRAADTRKLLRFNLHIVRLLINALALVAGSFLMITVKNTLVLSLTQALFVSAVIAINAKPLVSGVKTAIYSIKS